MISGLNGMLDSTRMGDDTIQDGALAAVPGNIFPYLADWDVMEQAGVAAQGNLNPPAQFVQHFVVVYNGRIYDPSYGGTSFASEEEHENTAIDGIARVLKSGAIIARKADAAVRELVYTHHTVVE